MARKTVQREKNNILTQFLTRNGLFAVYLHKIRKNTNPRYCKISLDDVEQMFFACTAWAAKRTIAE